MKKRPNPKLDWLKTQLETINDECLIWPFSVRDPWNKNSPRPTMSCEGKSDTSYAIAHLLTDGEILAPGEQWRHTCNQNLCVNPKHTIRGTAKENTRDSIEAGRFPKNTHRHPIPLIAEIKYRRLIDGWSYPQIYAAYPECSSRAIDHWLSGDRRGNVLPALRD